MKKSRQSKIMQNVPMSGIREVISYANKLEQQGKEIIHLELGEPDFDTPQYIKDAAKKAIDEGKVHYPPFCGIPELRKAIAQKLSEQNGLTYTPDEIIVTIGVAQGIYAAFMSFINPGDEILIPNPGFLNYLYVPTIVDGVSKFYTLSEDTGFQVDIQEMKCLITKKTKMIILVSPNNPTGLMLSKKSLESVAEVAKENDLLVVSDEVYGRITYDGKKHISIASFPGMKERTIVLDGFSKYYAMTGWRLGYIAAPEELMDPMMRFCFYNTTSANSFAQWGALAAVTQGDEPSREMVAEYARRRDFLVDEINNLETISCVKPDGAFYVLMNIKQTGLSSGEFSKYLLDEAGVATVPGTVFGKAGEGYVRLSYANSYENINNAITKIGNALMKL